MTDVVVKARRMVAANGKWDVYFDHLSDNHGNEVPNYLVIEGPLNRPDRVTGVSVLPVLDGRFVLLKCYRHALRSYAWEAPRGFIDAGETPEQAALRELTEETGLTCAPANLIPLGLYAPEPSTIGGRGALFGALACTGSLRPPGDEIGLDSIRQFDQPSLAMMVSRGEVEDAGTLIAYYRMRALATRVLPRA